MQTKPLVRNILISCLHLNNQSRTTEAPLPLVSIYTVIAESNSNPAKAKLPQDAFILASHPLLETNSLRMNWEEMQHMITMAMTAVPQRT